METQPNEELIKEIMKSLDDMEIVTETLRCLLRILEAHPSIKSSNLNTSSSTDSSSSYSIK